MTIFLNLLMAALNAVCIAWLVALDETQYVWMNVAALVVCLLSAAFCAGIERD